jgi:hypothetical protein
MATLPKFILAKTSMNSTNQDALEQYCNKGNGSKKKTLLTTEKKPDGLEGTSEQQTEDTQLTCPSKTWKTNKNQ